MRLVQTIKELAEVWRIELNKRKEQTEKYRIEYAFTSGGTKYYQFADITNLPFERGITAMCVYNEVEMRCSREFLLKYTAKMDEVLNANKIDIFKINELNGILKDRLTLTADLDLAYKLASVVYFDKSENPYKYEPEYAAKKIEKWRKDKSVSDFFTLQPLRELMPYLIASVGNADAFMELNEQLNALHNDLMRLNGSINKSNNSTNGAK